jgi:hypothetical protein
MKETDKFLCKSNHNLPILLLQYAFQYYSQVYALVSQVNLSYRDEKDMWNCRVIIQRNKGAKTPTRVPRYINPGIYYTLLVSLKWIVAVQNNSHTLIYVSKTAALPFVSEGGC